MDTTVMEKLKADANKLSVKAFDGELFWIRNGKHGEEDAEVIREVFVNDTYKVKSLAKKIAPGGLVVDVGAHIGSFAKLWHKIDPTAKIVCVEVCPENIPALRENVGSFADVIQAACTYEPGEISLDNSYVEGGTATGGSAVVVNGEPVGMRDHVYWRDTRPIAKVSLEDILAKHSADRIALLKLDCEGSEYSILGNTPSILQINYVVGEYHNEFRLNNLIHSLFRWDCEICYRCPHLDVGVFHMRRL